MPGGGGELVYWPDGPDGPVAVHEARPNTAVVLDTDTIFHGVDRVADVSMEDLPRLRPGMTLDFASDDRWVVHDADGTEVIRYRWSDLRFSVSWKAYCFADERERDTWRTHADDLTLDHILDRLVDDLGARGVVAPDAARNADLGRILIDEYVRFPLSAC
jgi:hypothetical protein